MCCTRLSVGLATGAVSVREVLQRLDKARRALVEAPPELRAIPVTALDSLIARRHWRGHFMQKLESEPELETRSFHPLHQAARSSTAPDDPVLAAWAIGRTGIPFVDACMRSLIATGWLNFRMRAMLQSFASYQLGLDWRVSGERLARLFSDYEPGIHWPQVQMQSGQTGINTPRIYNPVKQGRDQDPDGRFTRQWVPELAHLSTAVLQTPWLATGADPADYPQPIVDPSAAARLAKDRLTILRRSAGYREASLAGSVAVGRAEVSHSALRRTPGYREAALAVFQKHGSRKRRFTNDGDRGRQAPRRLPPTAPAQLSLGFDEPEPPVD